MSEGKIFLSLILMTVICLRLTQADYYYDSLEDYNLESEVQNEANNNNFSTTTTSTPSTEAYNGSTVGPDVELRQQATENSNALKQLAEVMSTLIEGSSKQGCFDRDSSQLSSVINEGFSLLVDALKDLNSTLHHYQNDINRKVFGTSAAIIFENDGPCPSPFFLSGTDCIYVETEHLRHFDAARQACLEMGAKLGEFLNIQAFINAVSAMDLHNEMEIYIGGTDEDNEGIWRWLSGGRINDINWDSDEPSNSGDGEHCLSYKANTRSFNDIPCSYRREYACTKK